MQIEAAGRAIEELHAFLRRELASVAAYEEALEELGTDATPVTLALTAMAREHARNVRTLRMEIARLGGSPVAAAGVFAALGRERDGGEAALLSALIACEERSLRAYEEAVGRLPGACGALLGEVLVPARRRHVAALKHLRTLAAAEAGAGHDDCTLPAVAEGPRITPDAKEVAL